MIPFTTFFLVQLFQTLYIRLPGAFFQGFSESFSTVFLRIRVSYTQWKNPKSSAVKQDQHFLFSHIKEVWETQFGTEMEALWLYQKRKLLSFFSGIFRMWLLSLWSNMAAEIPAITSMFQMTEKGESKPFTPSLLRWYSRSATWCFHQPEPGHVIKKSPVQEGILSCLLSWLEHSQPKRGILLTKRGTMDI